MDLNTREISTSDLIRVIMQIEHTNTVQLSKKLDSTPQNVSQRLKHGNFRENDLTKIANALGYDMFIEFVKRED